MKKREREINSPHRIKKIKKSKKIKDLQEKIDYFIIL